MASQRVKHVNTVNKQEYFNYHLQIAAEFQKDCEKLLLTFEATNDLTFKSFATIWRKMEFYLLFQGIALTEELISFTDYCFYTIQKYIIFCKGMEIKLGAFYMLYALYKKQPTKSKVRIRCTAEMYKDISKFLQKTNRMGIYDASYLFEILKCNYAFKLVIFPNMYGLEGRFMWQEKELRNDTFKDIKQGDPFYKTKTVLHSSELYGLRAISDLGGDYALGLRKYGISEKICEAVINLPSELEGLLNEMERCDGDLSVEDDSRMKKLKSKAFTSKVTHKF